LALPFLSMNKVLFFILIFCSCTKNKAIIVYEECFPLSKDTNTLTIYQNILLDDKWIMTPVLNKVEYPSFELSFSDAIVFFDQVDTFLNLKNDGVSHPGRIRPPFDQKEYVVKLSKKYAVNNDTFNVYMATGSEIGNITDVKIQILYFVPSIGFLIIQDFYADSILKINTKESKLIKGQSAIIDSLTNQILKDTTFFYSISVEESAMKRHLDKKFQK
jgi:hypothetical protein